MLNVSVRGKGFPKLEQCRTKGVGGGWGVGGTEGLKIDAFVESLSWMTRKHIEKVRSSQASI